MGRRHLIAFVLVSLALLAAVLGSAAGLFGGARQCGADQSPGCVTWPLPVSGAIWLAFILGVAALVIWQVRFLDR
jgi:hypothetical protein